MSKEVYCGYYACNNHDCKYHMTHIERADIPHDYLNLKGSILCPLERSDDGKKIRAGSE